jgi:hypothetical protein
VPCGGVTACDSESWKFFDWRPREVFLSSFLVTRVTPSHQGQTRAFFYQDKSRLNMNEVRFRTTEVAWFAEVTLSQLQVWEAERVAGCIAFGPGPAVRRPHRTYEHFFGWRRA